MAEVVIEAKTLDLKLDGGWLDVWFNSPETRNPLTDARAAELRALCAVLRDRRDIRGVTFRGRGGFFCAGGDLKSFQKMFAGATREDIVAMSKGAAELFRDINTLPQVTVMAIEGAAMAGGFGLACCGDVVIVHPSAMFAFTETRIGLSPAQISPFVIQRLGARIGRRLMLTGATFTGAEAEAFGFADTVTEDINGAIADVKAGVLKCAPGAVAATKALILDLPNMTREETAEAAAHVFADRLTSDEGREGVMSFAQKRKPKWVTKEMGQT
jgi:isohexenylglutaconyl-CoA hydratase